MNQLDQNNELESYLKGQADKLRMIPSQNIWNSIYNDIHPSKRWPSVRILVLMLLAISTLSYFNTNIENEINDKNVSIDNSDNLNVIATTDKNIFSSLNDNDLNKTFDISLSSINNSKILDKKRTSTIDYKTTKNNDIKIIQVSKNISENNNSNFISRNANNVTNNTIASENIDIEYDETENISKLANSPIDLQANDIDLDNQLKNKLDIMSIEEKQIVSLIASKKPEQNNSKKVKIKKWATAIDFTPLYTFRNLTENASYSTALYNVNAVGINPNQKKNDKLVLGFQTSINGLKHLNQKTDLVLGIGYSHKKFNIAVSHSDAPVFATILQTIDNNYTNLGVVTRNVVTNLNNSSYNNSSHVTENNKELFLNMELRKVLASFKTNKLILGLGLQPFLNLNRSSYLLSNDTKNYAKVDGSKKYFNANLNLTLGYQFPISHRSTLDLNALFQSQFSPSYDKKFTLQEQLRSGGLRLRIITQL